MNIDFKIVLILDVKSALLDKWLCNYASSFYLLQQEPVFCTVLLYHEMLDLKIWF